MKSIDILIPTYNRSFLLKNVVENILKQSYKYMNIIIADNNSTDDTQDIGKNLSKIYDNVFYYRNNKNLGIYGNYDFSLRNYCKSEYVLILSDDDFFTDFDYIKRAMKYIKQYNLVWIGAGYNIVNINSKKMKSFKRKESFLGTGINFLKIHKFGLDNFAWFTVIFNRKEAIKHKFDINLYNADYLPIFIMDFNKNRMILNEIVGTYTINNFQSNYMVDQKYVMEGYKLYFFLKEQLKNKYQENIFIQNVKDYINAAFKNLMDKDAIYEICDFNDVYWIKFFKNLENEKFYPFFDKITSKRYTLFKKNKKEFKKRRLEEINNNWKYIDDEIIKRYIRNFDAKNN